MKYWEGLGYYSRARNLHAAAKTMNGHFPTTYEGVLALKGVGEYTAAAICSFAFGMPYAVIDGNVYRVLARYFAMDAPIDTTEGKAAFRKLAAECLDRREPARYNQAIMDFGALQCTPHAPDCLSCPLVETCGARIAGNVEQVPVKSHKTAVSNRYLIYMRVQAGDYVFVRRREGNDIWRKLFEYALIETNAPVAPDEVSALPAFQSLFAGLPTPTLILRRSQLKHVLSHRVLYADCYDAILPASVTELSGYRRVALADVSDYAFPRMLQLVWGSHC
jgi:A/G-specific adenine glycosylase